MRKKLFTLFSIGLLLGGWQLFALTYQQPEWIPTVPRLLATTGGLFLTASFYESVAATVVRGITGMAFSLAAAFACAWLLTRRVWIDELFRPVLAFLRSVPVISFILFALIFLQPESIPLLIAFLTMFPLLTENLTNGIRHLRPGLTVMGRQFRIGRYNRIAHLIYPQLKPYLYSGLASAAGFGWRAIIMGEVLSQAAVGIGGEMKKAQNFMAVPDLLAWTMVAVGLSYLFDKGITWLAERMPPIRFSRGNGVIKEKNPSPIRACEISYLYGIRNFSYTFLPHRIYGISAPSGKGKTTLLNLLNGTLVPTEGHVEIDRSFGIASVFQEPELLPHLTVLENIEWALSLFCTEKEAQRKAMLSLGMVEMEAYADRLPDALSYGQQQRVAIARALAFPSAWLFMDEPFKGLDRELTLRIIRRMAPWQKQRGQTVLFTSHNREELELLSNECLSLG